MTEEHPHRDLRAGPVRVKLADGEIRYLYVDGQEIIRRIYFAVRDEGWDTVMPVFSVYDVEAGERSFRVQLEARCRSDKADYSWKGVIEGDADGTVRFSVTGRAEADFNSPRIGLCILYGADELTGISFDTVTMADDVISGEFTPAISAALAAADFHTLRYRTSSGLGVSTAIEGSRVDMEDQRNYGDSSWKAYAPLPHSYDEIIAGAEAQQTVTVTLSEVPAAAAAVDENDTLAIDLSQACAADVVMPAHDPQCAGGPVFMAVNGTEAGTDGTLMWSFAPFNHMPDDDTLCENVRALSDQIMTARAAAPAAEICICPITLNVPYTRTQVDPRISGDEAAVFLAASVRQAAISGAASWGTDLGPGSADAVRGRLARLAGSPCRVLTLDHSLPRPDPVIAFVAAPDTGDELWLCNLTAAEQAVEVRGLPPVRESKCEWLAGRGGMGDTRAVDGVVTVSLAPFSVMVAAAGL